MSDPARLTERAAYVVLGAGGLLVMAHAFVPLEEFIHRTDDAFYYFKIAYNYPEVGFWSFDSIHSTNGVQPLWAWMLTAIAQVMAWAGVRDPDLFARAVVGVTGALHVATSLLLLRLLARQVNLGAGIAAAAGYLLPLGIAWRHVWGMENSLYAFFLVVALSYYQRSFRGQQTGQRAVVLGLLLGLTALSRLNAALLAVCAVGAIAAIGGARPARERFRHAAIVAAVSAACVVPYLALNYASTGHPLPISGAVKAMNTTRYLDEAGIDSRASLSFVSLIASRYEEPLRQFVIGPVADASTILGGRILFGDDARRGFIALLGLAAVAPLLLGSPRRWALEVAAAYGRLGAFWFVPVFALVNFVASVFAYPHQIANAMTKWWLVESELTILVLAATLVGTAAAYIGARIVPRRAGPWLITAGLVLVVALHGQRTVRVYWDGQYLAREWNPSWNDESLRAAQWLAANAPEDAIVGSWNAGVLGYYAKQRVTNLDGLINNFDLLEHLRNGTIAEYISRENIEYLSDMESMLTRYNVVERLTLSEVYRMSNALTKQDYVIYRVVSP